MCYESPTPELQGRPVGRGRGVDEYFTFPLQSNNRWLQLCGAGTSSSAWPSDRPTELPPWHTDRTMWAVSDVSQYHSPIPWDVCVVYTMTVSMWLLRVLENRVLRQIFVPKRDEVTWEWRRLHNEEFYDPYSSPNIIREIKSKRMRRVAQVACWRFG
jgi:hypothetical protein